MAAVSNSSSFFAALNAAEVPEPTEVLQRAMERLSVERSRTPLPPPVLRKRKSRSRSPSDRKSESRSKTRSRSRSRTPRRSRRRRRRSSSRLGSGSDSDSSPSPPKRFYLNLPGSRFSDIKHSDGKNDLKHDLKHESPQVPNSGDPNASGDVQPQPASQKQPFIPLFVETDVFDAEEERIAIETNGPDYKDHCVFCEFEARDDGKKDSWKALFKRLFTFYGKIKTVLFLKVVQDEFMKHYRKYFPDNERGKKPYMTKMMILEHVLGHDLTKEVTRRHQLRIIHETMNVLEQNGMCQLDEFGKKTIVGVNTKMWLMLQSKSEKLQEDRR